jgi:hypothetical protein
MTRRWTTWAAVAALFTLLTAAMAWPMVRHATSLAPQHHDVFFNMWRLRWFAHALVTSPAHLFDGNIYYPEKNTLAYSDAMFVEGLIAAPLVGLNPVLVHNLMMLLPIAASAVTLFALAWYLTGSRGAGVIAGTAFAFAPIRFEHIMHMEIQWTVWTPLAFLALHRTFESGRWKHGLAAGGCAALQMLSCIYYGTFLATLLSVAAVLSAFGDRRVALKQAALPLAAGALLAATVSGLYAIPYRQVHALVGDRPAEEVNTYSARPNDYLTVPVGNVLYGDPLRPGHGERRLYPGAIVTLLAIVGVTLRRPSPRVIIYVIVLALAFDMSLGFSGFSYPVLSRLFGVFRSLRALARLGIFVVMCLAILAAYGYTFLLRRSRPMVRAIACALLVGAMLAEYRTTFEVSEFTASAPPVYRVLAHLEPGVVMELPVPRQDRLPGSEAEYAYLSTFHWFPLANGYSGNYPPSYLIRLDRLLDFPSDRGLRQLRHDNVKYVIVHSFTYKPLQLDRIRTALLTAGMAEVGTFSDGTAPATVFAMR